MLFQRKLFIFEYIQLKYMEDVFACAIFTYDGGVCIFIFLFLFFYLFFGS